MKDRVPLYPGRVKLTPVSGQENTYDMVRSDEPTQEGTPLSKATFLKDATAALFGLDATAVPDDALALLSRFHKGLGNEYVWSKEIISYVPSADEESKRNYSTFYFNTTYYCADEYDVVGGKFVFNDYTSVAVNSGTDCKQFEGKYVTSTDSVISDGTDEILFIPANNGFYSDTLYGTSFWAAAYVTVLKNPRIERLVDLYGYVNSPDPSAYPPAVSDGYTYTALGQLGAKVQIATGSYTGTGEYYNSSKYMNTLMFPFVPKIVFITPTNQGSSGYCLWAINGQTSVRAGALANYETYLQWNGNSLSWYSANNASHQLNVSGEKYAYIAIS